LQPKKKIESIFGERDPQLLFFLVSFFRQFKNKRSHTYVHATYDNASSPSFVGHLWIILMVWMLEPGACPRCRYTVVCGGILNTGSRVPEFIILAAGCLHAYLLYFTHLTFKLRNQLNDMAQQATGSKERWHRN
jgi:predicted metal-binding membrane protein